MGILTKSGKIDTKRMKIIRELIPNIKLTFHRACDVCIQSIEQIITEIIEISCDRLLTSGKGSTAINGLEQIKSYVDIISGHIEIIAACGINSDNVISLIQETNIKGIHASSSMIERKIEFYSIPQYNNWIQVENQDDDQNDNQIISEIVNQIENQIENELIKTDTWEVVSLAKVIELVNKSHKVWGIAPIDDESNDSDGIILKQNSIEEKNINECKRRLLYDLIQFNDF